MKGSITDLKNRNRIFGPIPSLEEILDPVEEHRDSPFTFERGDSEIVAQVHHELAVERGETIEVESDDDGDDNGAAELTISEVTRMCQQLEHAGLRIPAKSSLELL